MSAQLTIRRSHLNENRRLLIGRAMAAAAASSIPVPGFDSWIASTIMRGALRRVANRHRVDISAAGMQAVVDGPAKPPKWAQLAGSTILMRILSKSWRRAVITYVAAQRARAAAKYFSMGTLFDHYCARLHVGLGIDDQLGAQLHSLMLQAIETTPGALGTEPFRRALTGLGRAAIKAPFEILDFTSRGALRRLLGRSDELEAVAELDAALERENQQKSGFMAKATGYLEMELAAEVNPYMEKLIASFEQLWHKHCEENSR